MIINQKINMECVIMKYLKVIFMILIFIISCTEEKNIQRYEKKKDQVLNCDKTNHIDLIHIPKGNFIQGRRIGLLEKYLMPVISCESAQYLDEGPRRASKVEEGFYISKYKVTCHEFSKFLNESDVSEVSKYYSTNKFSKLVLDKGLWKAKPGMDRYAINTVEWEGAVAYCKWLSKRTGRKVRLPSEKEWEFVAKGPSYQLNGIWEYYNSPVDSHAFDSIPEGVVGMISVAHGEWCSDNYDSSSHVLRGRTAHSSLTARTPGGKIRGDGIYCFRIVVEED